MNIIESFKRFFSILYLYTTGLVFNEQPRIERGGAVPLMIATKEK